MSLIGKEVVLSTDGGWQVTGVVVLDNDSMIILETDDESSEMEIVYKSKICTARVLSSLNSNVLVQDTKENTEQQAVQNHIEREVAIVAPKSIKEALSATIPPPVTPSGYGSPYGTGSFLPADMLTEKIDDDEDFSTFFGPNIVKKAEDSILKNTIKARKSE